MGTGGYATSVHCHIEVSPTLETSWVNNGQTWYFEGKANGVYVLPNGIEFEDAFFMNDTNIIAGEADWKYVEEKEEVEETKEVEEVGVDKKLWYRVHVQNEGG